MGVVAGAGTTPPAAPPRNGEGSDNGHPSPLRGGAGGEVNPEPKATTADVLEALHRATRMPIVADFYTRLYKPESVSVKRQPIFDALNQIADTMHLR